MANELQVTLPSYAWLIILTALSSYEKSHQTRIKDGAIAEAMASVGGANYVGEFSELTTDLVNLSVTRIRAAMSDSEELQIKDQVDEWMQQ